MPSFLSTVDVDSLISAADEVDNEALISYCFAIIRRFDALGYQTYEVEDREKNNRALGIFLQTVAKKSDLKTPFTSSVVSWLRRGESRGNFLGNLVSFFAQQADEKVVTLFREIFRQYSLSTQNFWFATEKLYTAAFTEFYNFKSGDRDLSDITLQEEINIGSMCFFNYFDSAYILSAIMNLPMTLYQGAHQYIKNGYDYYIRNQTNRLEAPVVDNEEDRPLNGVTLRRRALPFRGRLEKMASYPKPDVALLHSAILLPEDIRRPHPVAMRESALPERPRVKPVAIRCQVSILDAQSKPSLELKKEELMASSHAAKFRPFDPGDDTWAGIATRSRSFRDKESSGDQLSLKREDLSEESMIPPIPRYHRKRSKVVTAEPEVCDPMHLRSSVAALPESMRTSMVIPLCSSGAAKLTRPTEVLPRSAAERALTLTRSDAVYPARSLARLAVRHGAPALRAPRFEVLDDVTQFGENDSNGKFASLERAREEQRKTVPRAAHF